MKIPQRKTPTSPANKPETNIPAVRKNHSSSAKTKAGAGKGTIATAETSEQPTRAKPHRKIDAATIAGMAKLCAKMLNESEACRRLGIRPKAWFDWKSRANRTARFAEMLEAFRADRIESLIDRIEKSANGTGGVKYPDWRAALAILKFTDQKRFGEVPAVENKPCPAVTITLIHQELKKVIGFDSPAPALPPAPVGGTLPAPEQKEGEHHEN